MRYDLVVRSRRTVLPEGTRAAAVAVSGPSIAAIASYGERLDAARAVDLGDLPLLPGLVDTHVHVNEPGRTEWEGFATATRAAAAGGVTTICDIPLQLGLSAVWTAAPRRGRTLDDMARWMAAAPAELAGLPAKGRIAVGCDADLAAFDPEESFVVDPARLEHRHPVTPTRAGP